VNDADREILTNLVEKHLSKSGALYPPAPLTETDSFKQSPEQLAFVKSEYVKQMQEYERAKLSALSGENTVRYLTGNPAPLGDDAALHAPHARVGAEHAPNTQPVLHAPHARVGGLEVGSIEAYEAADSAKVGSSVGCPQCGTEFTKRNQQHRFCCKEHRFAWHNDQDPKRKEFMNSRSSKAA